MADSPAEEERKEPDLPGDNETMLLFFNDGRKWKVYDDHLFREIWIQLWMMKVIIHWNKRFSAYHNFIIKSSY